jgi:type II secretory pathway pseudopilin PulG
MELLIVIIIIGLTVGLGFSGINSAFKRQRLGSAAGEVATLAGRALTEMQNRNSPTFIAFGKYVARFGTDAAVVLDVNANLVCDEAVDPNNDGLFDDAAANVVLWRTRIPADVALSNLALNGQTFNGQWARPTAGPVSAALLCDFMGRAMIPSTTVPTPPATVSLAAVATGPATVQFCHEHMIEGSLTPLVTYTVSIAPLFKATLTRVP